MRHPLDPLLYELLPCVGSDITPVQGNLISLLLDLPYFIMAKVVPPRLVINEILCQGVHDAGMSGGCQWTSFELSNEEYQAVVEVMQAHGFRPIETPGWVCTASDWRDWQCGLLSGIPAEESRTFSQQIRRLSTERERAQEHGDDETATDRLCELNSLCMEYSEFVNAYRAAGPKFARVGKRPKLFESHRRDRLDNHSK